MLQVKFFFLYFFLKLCKLCDGSTNKSRGQTPTGLNQCEDSDFRTLTPQLHKPNQNNNSSSGWSRQSRIAALRPPVACLPIKLKWQLARDSRWTRPLGASACPPACLSVCLPLLQFVVSLSVENQIYPTNSISGSVRN